MKGLDSLSHYLEVYGESPDPDAWICHQQNKMKIQEKWPKVYSKLCVHLDSAESRGQVAVWLELAEWSSLCTA